MSHRTVSTVGAIAFLIACAWAGWSAGSDGFQRDVRNFTHYTIREAQAQ